MCTLSAVLDSSGSLSLEVIATIPRYLPIQSQPLMCLQDLSWGEIRDAAPQPAIMSLGNRKERIRPGSSITCATSVSEKATDSKAFEQAATLKAAMGTRSFDQPQLLRKFFNNSQGPISVAFKLALTHRK